MKIASTAAEAGVFETEDQAEFAQPRRLQNESPKT